MSSRILIVDDDGFYRFITKELLEQSGYLVETALDGLEAWELIDSAPSRFDLILLDRKMPKLNGLGLLKRIKSDKRFEDLLVIMLTGANTQEEISEGLTEGAYYYLTKPTTEDALKRVIKNVLAELHQKRELLESIGRQKNNFKLLRSAEFSLRTLAEAKELAILLADVSMDAQRTLSGYSELLINAIEHGNLNISYAEKSFLLQEDRWVEEIEARLLRAEYCARTVSVSIEITPSECIVTISDQGNGFDWANYVDFKPERAFDLHGRGIAMSKALSFDAIEYLGCGNRVKTKVFIRQ